MNFLQQFRKMLESLDESIEGRSDIIAAMDKVDEQFSEAIKRRDTATARARDAESLKGELAKLLGLEGDEIGIDKFKETIDGLGKKQVGDVNEKHEAELSKLREIVTGLESKNAELQTAYNDQLFKAEIENAGLLNGFKDNPLLRQTVVNHLKESLLYKDGGIYVKGSDGEPQTDIKTGELLTPASVVDAMKESPKWADFMAPTAGHGGGTPPTAAGQKAAVAINRAQFEGMKPAAQMEHIKAGGTVTD